jgi:hypothetical protein
MSAGKGDDLRPVNGEKFRSNYDKIFQKHQPHPFEYHANYPGPRKPSRKATGNDATTTAAPEPK